jgi:hypothetical protein
VPPQARPSKEEDKADIPPPAKSNKFESDPPAADEPGRKAAAAIAKEEEGKGDEEEEEVVQEKPVKKALEWTTEVEESKMDVDTDVSVAEVMALDDDNVEGEDFLYDAGKSSSPAKATQGTKAEGEVNKSTTSLVSKSTGEVNKSVESLVSGSSSIPPPVTDIPPIDLLCQSRTHQPMKTVPDVKSRYKHTPSVMKQWAVKFKGDVVSPKPQTLKPNPSSAHQHHTAEP